MTQKMLSDRFSIGNCKEAFYIRLIESANTAQVNSVAKYYE